jgi:hypothetical protein
MKLKGLESSKLEDLTPAVLITIPDGSTFRDLDADETPTEDILVLYPDEDTWKAACTYAFQQNVLHQCTITVQLLVRCVDSNTILKDVVTRGHHMYSNEQVWHSIQVGHTILPDRVGCSKLISARLS